MKIDKRKNYTLILLEKESFSAFFDIIKENKKKIEQEHIIIDFSKKNDITEKEILLFSNLIAEHKNNNLSFILVYPKVNIDNFPEDFNIVPTLKEAEDVLDMENIQRDLGF